MPSFQAYPFFRSLGPVKYLYLTVQGGTAGYLSNWIIDHSGLRQGADSELARQLGKGLVIFATFYITFRLTFYLLEKWVQFRSR